VGCPSAAPCTSALPRGPATRFFGHGHSTLVPPPIDCAGFVYGEAPVRGWGVLTPPKKGLSFTEQANRVRIGPRWQFDCLV